MAIVIEEEKNQNNIIAIAMYLVFLVIIGAVLYYIFFKQPTLIEVAVPESFENTAQLSRIELNPRDVVADEKFQSLKQYVTPPSPGNVGRANPFISF
jgi:hypothetical protein